MTTNVSALRGVIRDVKAYNSVKRDAWAGDPSVKRADNLLRQAEEELDLVATALAEARAEGRRQGLEEAPTDEVEVASRCIAARRKGWAYCDAGRVTEAEWKAEVHSADAAIFAIRRRQYLSYLAASTETQKPETGESR